MCPMRCLQPCQICFWFYLFLILLPFLPEAKPSLWSWWSLCARLNFYSFMQYFTIKATSIFPVSKLYITGLIDITVSLFLFNSMFLRFLHVDPCLWRAHFKCCVLFHSKSIIELMCLSPVAGYRLVTISHCNEQCHSGQFLSKSLSAYQVLP